jgi:hypothetical protein
MMDRKSAPGIALLLLLALSLAGCRYQGDGIDSPFERKVQWFSFIAGDDIRDGCRPAASDRYRLVYNGFWREQVRIYELGRQGPNILTARVIERGALTLWSSGDPLAPWRGKTADTLLDPAGRQRLIASLAVVSEPPPVGLRLPSDGFYWTAAACVDGHFHSTAWLFPTAAFAALRFPQELLALDHTGVAYNAPDPIAYAGNYDQSHLAAERWFLTVGKDGLSGNGIF